MNILLSSTFQHILRTLQVLLLGLKKFKLDNHCSLNINTAFVWILPFSPESAEVNVQFIEQPEVQE